MLDIDIYIDFKSPAAYLALKPTLALLADSAFNPRWFPHPVKQHGIPQEKTSETRGETHSRVRENARRQTHLKYADLQRTPMRFRDPPGESDLALAALLGWQDDPVPYIEAAFRAYWVEQLDLNNVDVVKQLLSNSGYDAQEFVPEASLADLAAQQLQAQELGVIDVPAYIVAGNLFIGREHMPWIRELLTGA